MEFHLQNDTENAATSSSQYKFLHNHLRLTSQRAAVLFTQETDGAHVIAPESWPALTAIAGLLARFNDMTLCFSEQTSSLDQGLQQYHQLQFDLNQAL